MKRYEVRHKKRGGDGWWTHVLETFDTLPVAKLQAERLMRLEDRRDVTITELTYSLGSSKDIPLAPITITQDVWLGARQGGSIQFTITDEEEFERARKGYHYLDLTWYHVNAEFTKLT